jgi:hypothetical protein
MFIAFNQMPDDSRVWIYQADRQLEMSEVAMIDLALRQFTQHWEAHQHPLQASYQILYNRFIILAVDASYHEPSGCSIDKSVAIIKQIEQDFNLNLFDRLTIAYLDGTQVKAVKNKDLKEKIEKAEFLPETLIFNNTVQAKKDLSQHWQIPASQSWLARYFKKEMAV